MAENGKPNNMPLLAVFVAGIGALAGWVQIEISYAREDFEMARHTVISSIEEIKVDIHEIEKVINDGKFASKDLFDQHVHAGGVDHPYGVMGKIENIVLFQKEKMREIETQFDWISDVINLMGSQHDKKTDLLWQEVYGVPYPEHDYHPLRAMDEK